MPVFTGTAATTTDLELAADSACAISDTVAKCASTDPRVTYSMKLTGDTSHCTFTWRISWGDKSASQTASVVGQPQAGTKQVASHVYPSNPVQTYPIVVTAVSVRGAGCTIGSGGRYTFVLNPAPAGSGGVSRYVSLGDSYSSGEGTPPFDANTDIATNKCHRSALSWARILKNYTAYKFEGHFACSGATSTNLTTTAQHPGQPPQIQRLKAVSPIPDIVTVTIGGNDIGFSNVIKTCYLNTPAACVAAADRATTLINAKLPGLLATDYRQIHNAVKTATIVVVGYPNIMTTTSANLRRCGWLKNSDKSRAALVKLASTLDSTINKAVGTARGSGLPIQYASTLKALKDHELCTGTAFVRSIGVSGVWTQGPGHPTKEGQQLIAQAVANVIGPLPQF